MPKMLINENGRYVRREVTDLHSDRIRFNHGYHDGAFCFEHFNNVHPNWQRRAAEAGKSWEEIHHDSVWVAGFKAGFADKRDGNYHENSEAAWIASGRKNGYTAYRFGKAAKKGARV